MDEEGKPFPRITSFSSSLPIVFIVFRVALVRVVVEVFLSPIATVARSVPIVLIVVRVALVCVVVEV